MNISRFYYQYRLFFTFECDIFSLESEISLLSRQVCGIIGRVYLESGRPRRSESQEKQGYSGKYDGCFFKK